MFEELAATAALLHGCYIGAIDPLSISSKTGVYAFGPRREKAVGLFYFIA